MDQKRQSKSQYLKYRTSQLKCNISVYEVSHSSSYYQFDGIGSLVHSTDIVYEEIINLVSLIFPTLLKSTSSHSQFSVSQLQRGTGRLHL